MKRLLLLLLWLCPGVVSGMCQDESRVDRVADASSSDDEAARPTRKSRKKRTAPLMGSAASAGASSRSLDGEMGFFETERSAATLFVINSVVQTSFIDIDNGAMATALREALSSRKALVLLDSTTAIPMLLFSQYKRLNVDKKVGPADLDCAGCAREIFNRWQMLIKNRTPFEHKLQLMGEIKDLFNQAGHAHFDDVRSRLNALSLSDVGSQLLSWFAMAQEIDFESYNLYTIAVDAKAGMRHFILLVPRDFGDISRVFTNPIGVYEQVNIFSENARLNGLMGQLVDEQHSDKGAIHGAIENLFGEGTSLRWNIIFTGHGAPTPDAPIMVGLPVPHFSQALDFFNEKCAAQVNMLLWSTCYGGGDRAQQVLDHLCEKNAKRPNNFLIVSLDLLDASTTLALRKNFFVDLDDVAQRCTGGDDDAHALFACIGRSSCVRQVLALKRGSGGFEVVNTRQEPSPAHDTDTNRLLRLALADVEHLTPTSLGIIAATEAFLDEDLLRRLLREFNPARSVASSAGELLFAQACKRENMFTLVSLADVGVDVHALAMTDSLALRLNEHFEAVCRFVVHLSLEQRERLMAIAVRANLRAVIAALLSVEVAVRASLVIDKEFVEQLYKLPTQAFACAFSTLDAQQRKMVAAVAKKESMVLDVVKSKYAGVYASPTKARVTQAMVTFVEKKLSPSERAAFVDRVCVAHGSAWFLQALFERAYYTIELMLKKEITLADGVIDDRFIKAIGVLCTTSNDLGMRVMSVLSERQRGMVWDGVLTMLVHTAADGESLTAKRRYKKRIRTAVRILVDVLAAGPLECTLPLLDDELCESLADIFNYRAPLLAAAIAHLSDLQSAALSDQLQVRVATRLSRAKKGVGRDDGRCFEKNLIAFIALVRSPSAAIVQADIATAVALDRLPVDTAARLLAASEPSVRAVLHELAAQNSLYQLNCLSKSTEARRAEISQGIFFDYLFSGKCSCVSDYVVGVGIALYLEKKINSAHESERVGIFTAAMAALNETQCGRLACIVSLLDLKECKRAFEHAHMVVPTEDAVHFDEALAQSFIDEQVLAEFDCRGTVKNVQCLSKAHQNELALYARRDKNGKAYIPLLLANMPDPSRMITSPMVMQLACCWSLTRKNVLAGMTRKQRMQVAFIAQFFDCQEIVAVLRNSGVPIIPLDRIVPTLSLACTLNEASFSMIERVIARLSHRQINWLRAVACKDHLWRVCAALIIGGSVDVSAMEITLALVAELNNAPAPLIAQKLIERLSVEQLNCVAARAQLLGFDAMVDSLCVLRPDIVRVVPHALVIDADFARDCAQISYDMLPSVLARLTAVQLAQLYSEARRAGLEKLLTHLAAIDPKQFVLQTVSVEVEQIKEARARDIIIDALTEPQRHTLAALARIFDLKNIKKYLIMHNSALPALSTITIDASLAQALDASCPSAAILTQCTDSQLEALYNIAQECDYAHLLAAFRDSNAPANIKRVHSLPSDERGCLIRAQSSTSIFDEMSEPFDSGLLSEKDWPR